MPKSFRSRLLAKSSIFTALALLAAPAFSQSLSLLDGRMVEGTGGTSMLLFEARLSAPASGKVSFDFTSSDGTATVANSDYQQLPLIGLLSIPAGQTSLMISVPVVGDADIEANEYVVGSLSNVVGASVARGTAWGLIANDDDKVLVTAPHLPHEQAYGSSGTPSGSSAMSSDGRFVAFVSNGSDLAAVWPATIVNRIYVRDNRTGLTVLASVAADGGDSNGNSYAPVLSADGRYVAFESQANNLVPGDENLGADVFRRDLLTGTTELVSVNSAGTGPGDAWSMMPSISADGRYIAFFGEADDIAGGVYTSAIFLRDMLAGTTIRATENTWQGATSPQLSADGRYLAFDRNYQPWRRDLQTGVEEPVVVGFGGLGPNNTCYLRGISADGRYIVFWSSATNLVADAGSGVYVTDVQTHTTVFASRGSNGLALGNSWGPSISGDGRYVVFQSTNLAAGEPVDDSTLDIYLRDLQANTTTRVSQNYLGGVHSGGHSSSPTISRDGRFVSFLSESPTMLPGDNNNKPDVFRVALRADSSLPALSIYDMWVTEGDAGDLQANFYVGVSAPVSTPVVFDFDTADGTALAGDDYDPRHLVAQSIPVGQYWTTIAVPIKGDTLQEADEALNVYLGNVSGARLVDGHALLLVGNNDVPPPVPAISIADLSISEGDAGTQIMSFTVTLSHAAATDVSFDVSTANGTASAGSDYDASTQPGHLIRAGSTSHAVNVIINGDGVVEPNETFLVNISNVSGATVSDSQAVGTLSNDDAYPTFSIGDVSISEGNSGSQLATFTVQLSAPAASQVSYYLATASGTAAGGSDFTFRPATFQTIPVGASSATFTVSIIGDNRVEADETFLVNASSVSGATVVDGSAEGTILNDDVLPTLSIADVSINEGNSGTQVATFTVQLSAPAAEMVGYTIQTANGTAVAPGDYAAKNQTSSQWILIGASSTTFTVSINGDTAIEGNETFLVNISNVNGATVTDGSAVGTISNDDLPPTMSIADVSITEGNNSSKLATFTVTLSKAATGTVSFNIATANGTAVAPGDYTAKTATAQTIAAGALSKTFTVSIKGDKQVEPSETFFVNLSNVSANVTVADGQALGTIVNDDGAALSVARVTTGGLYDDVDDRRGDPVLASSEYALLLLDAAKQVCARAGGATIVGIDGVESITVLADLADTANRLCPRQPSYSATLKADGLGFLVDRGTQVLEVATAGAAARASSLTVLAAGHERPLTVLMAATPSAIASEREVQAGEINRLVRTRLAADPRARIVVLGAAGLGGLVNLTARSLPTAGNDAERIWVSSAVLEEFERAQLEIPGSPKPKPAQQVLQLQP